MAQLFHIGDILSIIGPRRLVSPEKMEGVYKILNFMTGDNLFTHQLGRVADECEPWLLAQYPQFSTPEFQTIEIGTLMEMLATPTGKKNTDSLVIGWLSGVAAKHTGGVMELPVKPLVREMHTQIDAGEELEAMVGKDRIITITEGQ